MKTLYRFRPLVHSIEWNDSRKKTLLFILYILLSLISFAADAGSAETPAAGQTINETAALVRNSKTEICFSNINIQPNISNGATGFLPVKPGNDQNNAEDNLSLQQQPICIIPRR